MKICYTFGGVGLFALSLTASALSLGQSQGQVVLGAPLDLVFQLQPDADMDAASSCVSAEVLLGDRRLDASRVSVMPVARRAGLPASVRLRASVVIDEPLVVVKLSAGCQGQTSRSYTFFAELPDTVAASAMPLDIGQMSALPAPRATGAVPARAPAAPRRATSASANNANNGSAKVATAPRPRKPAAKPSQAPLAPAGSSSAAAAAGGESRLRMEPLDAWVAPAAGAAAAASAAATSATAPGTSATPPPKPSPGAAAAPAAAAPAPATTAALPDSAAQTAVPAGSSEAADQRVVALEAELQLLKAREVSQNASLARISSQLEALQAANEQGSPWTLPLLAALAIVLALLAWLLLRLRRMQAAASGWRDSGDGYAMVMPGATAADTAFGMGTVPFTAPAAAASTLAGGAPSTRQDDPTTEFGLSAFGASMPADAGVAPHKPRDVVKPEELFDVRQQAEFFTSVGEYEQAIAVMRKHIAEHEDSSPLAYLELLGLFYQLSRKTEYEALRQQFEQHFAARVPDMAQFAQRGRSLAHYPELLANIEAQWPTEEVGELLESYLFRRPGQDSGVVFDLEAFDDLLLLQAVARTTSARSRGQTAARVRTTPTAAPVDTPPAATAVAAAAAAAASMSAGAAPLGEVPWATLERANTPVPAPVPFAPAPAPVPAPPVLMPLAPTLETPPPLSLDIPSRFDVPEGPFARAEPLSPEAASAPAASSLLDIDLSDVGRWQPLDLPEVEPLPFDLDEFPKRPIVGSLADQNVGFNAIDTKQPLPDKLELTPWEEESSPDSIFSAWNAARTERVIAKPVAEDEKNDKPEPGNGLG